MVAGFVAGTQRIGEHDMKVRPDEGEVVVAAVPENDVGFGFGGVEDPPVVDPGKNRVAGARWGSYSSRSSTVQCASSRSARLAKALDRRSLQVAVGHRVANHRHAQAAAAQQTRKVARGLRLAATGAHRRDRDHRQPDGSMVRLGPSRTKSAPAAITREATCRTCAWGTSL